jgi:opacity protein-like surface antigen
MKLHKILFLFACCMSVAPSFAGWQYNGYYVKDGHFDDDGSRFVIGGYGGISFVNGKIKNEMGSLQTDYFVDNSSGIVISGTAYDMLSPALQAEYTPIGIGDVSELPAAKNLSKTAFSAGGYVGFSLPYHPQWRLQAAFDHISEIAYDRIPLFEGEIGLTSGARAHVYSSGVQSTLTTDVVSVMAVYDFFDGNKKPLNAFIPYIGVGAGYAMSKTTVKLTDIFGDLSDDNDLLNYGTKVNDIIVFDNPTETDKYPASNNFALLGTIGASYGINEYTFIDLGARFMYIPKTTWAIASSDGSKHRDWFSADNMFYTTLNIGLRFEF